MARLGLIFGYYFSNHLMLRPGFEPTSVELHQPGTLWRTLYRLSYRATAFLEWYAYTLPMQVLFGKNGFNNGRATLPGHENKMGRCQQFGLHLLWSKITIVGLMLPFSRFRRHQHKTSRSNFCQSASQQMLIKNLIERQKTFFLFCCKVSPKRRQSYIISLFTNTEKCKALLHCCIVALLR